MRPSLIIFDCDGVLVDSEPVANRVLAEMITQAGLPTSVEECCTRYVGRTLESSIALIEQELGKALPENWRADLSRRERSVWEKELCAVPRVEAVLHHLRQDEISYCVASSGSKDKMHFTLGHTGLLPLVQDVLFSATEVARSKPHPDIFLHAAQSMGQPSTSCIVIEDSVFGVQGARAAGMRVFGYIADPHTDATGLKQAGAEVFSDMGELPALLGLS